MTAHDLFELSVELLLIKQLAAGGAIDPRAQFGNAVLVGVLHIGLARDEPCQHVVAEGEVGRSRGGPDPEQRDRSHGDPEYDGSETDLPAGMRDGVAVLRFLHRGWRGARNGAAGVMSSVIVRVMLRILGILTGTVRHRHSRAVLKQVPVGSTSMLI